MAKVSVVVPSYNKPQYLPECLRSVQGQTFTDWECIVVNDASPRGDEIRAAVKAMNDRRFRLVEHERNRGLAAARNTGIKRATSELVLWIDEDDLLRDDALEILKHDLEKQQADVSCPQAQFFGGSAENKPVETPSLGAILGGMVMIPGGFLTHKSTLAKTGLFDEHPVIKLGREDHEWWIRAVANRCSVSICKETLVFIRKPSSEEERRQSLDCSAHNNELRIYSYIVEKHKQYYDLYPEAKRRILRKCIRREVQAAEALSQRAKAVGLMWRGCLLDFTIRGVRNAILYTARNALSMFADRDDARRTGNQATPK